MIGCERVIRIAIACAVIAASPAVHAQPTATAAATVEFDKGRDLLKQGKFADACAAFARSQKLDPAPGTLYNLAGCYTKIGKLASAWLAYRELAQKDTKEARKRDSAKQAAALEPRLPKLLIVAPAPAPPGMSVTMNGETVTALVGIASPVDLGTYAIVAKAATYDDFTATADATREGATTTITIALAHPAAAKPPVAVVTAPPPPPSGPVEAHPDDRDAAPHSNRKAIGIATGAVGVAVIATGLVFGHLASGKWNDVKALCGDALACEPSKLAQGNSLSDTAHRDAGLSTGFVIGGAVIAAVGGYLFFTAPSLHVAPTVGGSTVGLSLEGGF